MIKLIMAARMNLKTLKIVVSVPIARPDYGLTTREKEVLALAAQGLSRTQIGEHLGLRLYTIGSHMKSIHRKLGVHNRAGAVAIALRKGLLADSMQRMSPGSKTGVGCGDLLASSSFNYCPNCGCNFTESGHTGHTLR